MNFWGYCCFWCFALSPLQVQTTVLPAWSSKGEIEANAANLWRRSVANASSFLYWRGIQGRHSSVSVSKETEMSHDQGSFFCKRLLSRGAGATITPPGKVANKSPTSTSISQDQKGANSTPTNPFHLQWWNSLHLHLFHISLLQACSLDSSFFIYSYAGF